MLNKIKISLFYFLYATFINYSYTMDFYEKENGYQILKNDFNVKTNNDMDSYEDEIFSTLGKSWELFKQQNYEEAFPDIYILSLKNVPQADYLIAQYYENGLGKIFKSPRDASKLYTKTIIDSHDDNLLYLEKKAKEGLNRLILSFK